MLQIFFTPPHPTPPIARQPCWS